MKEAKWQDNGVIKKNKNKLTKNMLITQPVTSDWYNVC